MDIHEIMTVETAEKELEKGLESARETVHDELKMERFLGGLETKIDCVPVTEEILGKISILVSLVKDYHDKKYSDIPEESIVMGVSALMYFVSSSDGVPDIIPFVGYIDDMVVIDACMNKISQDIEKYSEFSGK